MLGETLATELPHLDNSCASMTELRSPYNESNINKQASLHSDQYW